MILGLAVYDLATRSIRFVVEVKASTHGGIFVRLDHTTPHTPTFPDPWRGDDEWLDVNTPLSDRQKHQTDFDLIWGTTTR